MKISKSKRQLAQLLIEAGVTQFPDGANWAAQDKRDGNCMDRAVSFFGGKHKPKWFVSLGEMWRCAVPDTTFLGYDVSVALPTLIPNWHQTVLSRDEFDQIVAEAAPDADGWIEWSGGECPVERGTLVDVKYANGITNTGVSALTDKTHADHVSGSAGSLLARNWGAGLPMSGIIAYRLHKPEQAKPEFCESVMRSIPEPEAKPTIDQLLQDWRNADDFAKRKQDEADEAAAMSDERWQAVQARAGEMGVTIDHATEERSDEVLQITKRSQLELGDVIWIGESGVKEDEHRLPEGEYQVVKVGTIGVLHNGVTFYPDFSFRSWRFIRRP